MTYERPELPKMGLFHNLLWVEKARYWTTNENDQPECRILEAHRITGSMRTLQWFPSGEE